MVRTQVQLTEKQSARLKELAKLRGISVAELVRAGVERLLRASTVIDREERKRRAIAVAGRFRSGTSSMSSRHDDHLAEAYSR